MLEREGERKIIRMEKFSCPHCGAEEPGIDEGAILVCSICAGWVEKEKDKQDDQDETNEN